MRSSAKCCFCPGTGERVRKESRIGVTAAILEGCVSHRSGAGSVTWAWSGNPGGEYDKEREDLALLSHFLKKCLTSVCQALVQAGFRDAINTFALSTPHFTRRSLDCCWASDRPHGLFLLPHVQETLPFPFPRMPLHSWWM